MAKNEMADQAALDGPESDAWEDLSRNEKIAQLVIIGLAAIIVFAVGWFMVA